MFRAKVKDSKGNGKNPASQHHHFHQQQAILKRKLQELKLFFSYLAKLKKGLQPLKHDSDVMDDKPKFFHSTMQLSFNVEQLKKEE